MKFLFDHDVPDDLSHVLRQLGHAVVLLRTVLPSTTADSAVLRYATAHEFVLVTCNREDFSALAQTQPHGGIIGLFRRRSRVAERAALLRLLDTAGEAGIRGNFTLA